MSALIAGMLMGSGLRLRAISCGVAVAALLAGCGSIPSGGPAVPEPPGERNDPLGEAYVRLIPSPPQPGWSPERIVAGFLTAMASFDDDHSVARAYLTTPLRDSWSPGGHASVYAPRPLRRQQGSPERVTFTLAAPEVATIDADGQYSPAATGKTMRATFAVQRVRGEWRIAELGGASGLLLTASDVERTYRPLKVYFFDPQMRVLVPNPVFVPVHPNIDVPDTLVRALLRGPTSWLSPAVRSAFPAGTTLQGVRLDQGVVTVNLSRSVRRAGTAGLAAMAAQLVWTLKQIPDVQKVRLEAAGEGVATYDRDGWLKYDPSGFAEAGRPSFAYFQRDGNLYRLIDGKEEQVFANSGARPSLHWPAVSVDEGTVAGLSGDRTELRVAEVGSQGKQSVRLRGGWLSGPSWDAGGDLWVVEQPRGGSPQVWMLRGGRDPVKVEAPQLVGTKVRELRVARDGCRVAVAVQDRGGWRIELGRVVRERDGGVRLEGFLPLGGQQANVVSLAWRDADVIAVLGTGEGSLLRQVPVDGTKVTPLAVPVAQPQAIAAAPGVPLIVGDSSGQLFRSGQDGLNWPPVKVRGFHPVYPG